MPITPTGTITCDPPTGVAPANITFYYDGVEGGVVTWEWDFGDGTPIVYIQTPINGGTEPTPTYTHTYSNPGTYGVTMGITDGGGDVQYTSPFSITITDDTTSTSTSSTTDTSTSTSTSSTTDTTSTSTTPTTPIPPRTTCDPCYPEVPSTPGDLPDIVLPTTQTVPPVVITTTTPAPVRPLTPGITTSTTTITSTSTSTSTTSTSTSTTPTPKKCDVGCNALNF